VRRVELLNDLVIKKTKTCPYFHIYFNNNSLQFCGNTLGETVYKFLLFIGETDLRTPREINRIVSAFKSKAKTNSAWLTLAVELKQELENQKRIPYEQYMQYDISGVRSH
jgi:hypothetical protein